MTAAAAWDGLAGELKFGRGLV
ncbi:hypothetical protein [Mycobacterium riyadhense]